MTTLDIVASHVDEHATADDLVVVWPWYTTCVFHRYYHGKAKWIGLPDLEDKSWQYPTPFRNKMFEKDAIARETKLVVDNLKAGHRVWLVGVLPLRANGALILPAGPSPAQPALWNQKLYSDAWGSQVAELIRDHCERIEQVHLFPKDRKFLPDEIQGLMVVQGWR